MDRFFINGKKQAQPAATVKLTQKDFENNDCISVYWLGGGGAMINSFGTILLLDPLLKGFDMPLLIDYVADIGIIKHVDGYFVTHVDNDHFSRDTLRDLASVTDEVHSSHYVASLMKEECGVDAVGHTWHNLVKINDVTVEFTPADHNWQSELEEFNYRIWDKKEYSGFYIRTHGKKIWMVGDSRLMDEQLEMEQPDVILFDFSDNEFHIGLKNAIRLANTYSESKLVLIHWGTVDAPEMSPFNGNPQDILDNVMNPERVVILNPGEEFRL
ncbi:MBL fold metallo-hydrolase [Treponema sp.]|uniref:MBL fold metallo-hydrolase n=1 Tax=Treponema sp. TaxID=166 RepID=UPI00298EA6A5|nr:MBL fold metallo-hydrolase [Treponema sp.]MCQ2241687.1 MBL fold metallo-hydrolase [Treponema sp.]